MRNTNTEIIGSNALSYGEYFNLVVKLAESQKTTGEEQSTEKVSATKLNAQRMKRLTKQIKLEDQLVKKINGVKSFWNWTVLVEAWCGDAAQNVPYLAAMASQNKNIDLKIILRDENLEIIDAHQTNGSRSIPILICTNKNTGKEIGSWGPRPSRIALKIRKFKISYPEISHDEFVKNIHLWYAQDKGESIQEDFSKLISTWENTLT